MDTIYDAKLLVVDDNAELLALLYEQLRGLFSQSFPSLT